MTTHDQDLVGRDAEIARVTEVLAGNRLVTLVGPAGVGKSALAALLRQRSESARSPSRSPSLIVDASGSLEARELVRRLSRAAGVPSRSARAAADLLAQLAPLAAVLDERCSLLVIDDVEQVAPVHEVLTALLERTTRCSILATSRAATGVRGEVVFEVAPLDVDAGVALFQSRVRSSDANAYAHAHAPEHAVRALVERLDGLPLAIVLAAGRSSLLSIEALLARLDEPLGILRGGGADLSPRHVTLELAFESSLAALSAEERVAFACASVFEGTFSADAFEAVAAPGAGDATETDPLDALESLLRKSLVERSRSPGAVRFRLLHVVRAFARKHARDGTAEAESALRARYEAHVELAASRLARETYGASAERALLELEHLLPDVLAAMDSALVDRPARAAALWVSLFDVILFRDAVPLDDARFALAIAAADRAGDPALRVRARVLRARTMLELGPPEGAASDLREALALATEDPALMTEARRSLGWMALASGRPDEALRELEAALASSISLRDTRGHADSLAAMGLAEHLLGRPERGRESLMLARALHAQQKDELRRRRVDDMLRLVTPASSASADDAQSAEDALLEAASRHEARGQSFRLAFDMALLADLEEARGDVVSAAEHRLRARAAARVAGLQPLEEAIARRATASAPELTKTGWILGEHARTLRTPEGTSIDLVRHGSLRRVLEALVSARVDRPGVALTASEVLEAGWPGERVLHEAGLLRVYSAIRRLRRMGLETALVTRDDGYLLDPSVPVACEG